MAGADFCVKVAFAFGESPEMVLRLAGILPSLPEGEDPTIHEITELLKILSLENRQDILQYAKFRYQQEREKKP
jgi:hypothetical protein